MSTKERMDEEMSSLERNNTWELVQKPRNKIVVGCKWTYKIKDELTESDPKRFKAKLVAKGYTQKESIDFKEVFSLVVRHASIRILLSLTAIFDLESDQSNVKTDFLHSELQEEIYMHSLKDMLLQTRLIMYACSRSLSMA